MSDWDGKAVRESPRAGRWSGREQGRGRATDTKVIIKAASRGRHSPSYRASSPVVFFFSLFFPFPPLLEKTNVWNLRLATTKAQLFSNRYFFLMNDWRVLDIFFFFLNWGLPQNSCRTNYHRTFASHWLSAWYWIQVWTQFWQEVQLNSYVTLHFKISHLIRSMRI